jgi:hypothetical protein
VEHPAGECAPIVIIMYADFIEWLEPVLRGGGGGTVAAPGVWGGGVGCLRKVRFCVNGCGIGCMGCGFGD